MIADKIRNKEYGAFARGGGYAAGSVAQVYLLRKGVQKCGDWIDTKTYKPESFSKYMSPEDAKAYLEFLEHGSTAGLTDAELLGIQKVDDALALSNVNYGDLLALRSADELKDYYRTLEYGSAAGLTDAELLGIQKVDDYLALNKVECGDILALHRAEQIKKIIFSDMVM